MQTIRMMMTTITADEDEEGEEGLGGGGLAPGHWVCQGHGCSGSSAFLRCQQSSHSKHRERGRAALEKAQDGR